MASSFATDIGRSARSSAGVMTALPVPGVPAATTELLVASQRCLQEAAAAQSSAHRYAQAHLAALRAAAAVLACTSAPSGRKRPRSAWSLLAEQTPEFGPWASYFAAGATKRSQAEAGLNVVSDHEADELLRASVAFIELVSQWCATRRSQTVPVAVSSQRSRSTPKRQRSAGASRQGNQTALNFARAG